MDQVTPPSVRIRIRAGFCVRVCFCVRVRIRVRVACAAPLNEIRVRLVVGATQTL